MLVERNIERIALCCLSIGLFASCDLSQSPESICGNWLRERDVALDQMPSGRIPENYDSSRIRKHFDYEEFGRSQAKEFDDSTIVWFRTVNDTSFGCIVFSDSERPNAFIELSSDASEIEPIEFRIIGPN